MTTEYLTVPKQELDALKKRLKKLEKKVKRLERKNWTHADIIGRIEAAVIKLSERSHDGCSVRDLQRTVCQGLSASDIKKALQELRDHQRIGAQSKKAKNGQVINHFYVLGV